MHDPSLTKENFREYLDALEKVDAELLTTRFYTKDFKITAGEMSMDLAGLLEFETSLKSLADFRFHEKRIVADETSIAMEAIESFDVLQDGTLPNIGPAKKGERWNVHLIVFYGLKDGRISDITVHTLSVEKTS